MRIEVTHTFHHDGWLQADGARASGSNHGGGSGGSIFINAGDAC